MKRIFFVIFAVTAILCSSCTQDAIPIPDSLFAEETDLNFVGEGETYLNRVYTTSEQPIVIEIPENAREWLSADIEDGHLKIVAQRNANIAPRESSILLKTKERSTSIRIRQTGFPTKKLKIIAGRSSSEELSEGPFARTWDGNYDTYWHSRYSSPSAQYSEHWAEWDVEPGSPSIDMIMVFPRYTLAGANGRWGYYKVYIKGKGTDTPGVVPPGDFVDFIDDWGGELGSVTEDGFKLMFKGDESPRRGSYNPFTIVLPVPVANPVTVRVVLKGLNDTNPATNSTGGHASLGEIEFYGVVN